jgi:hypothetical protein
MVRLAVAGELIENADSLGDDSALGLQLQDVVIAASQSASVARFVLNERLRVETRGLTESAVTA